MIYDMEKVTPGKYVELGYDLYAIQPDGSEVLVHQTEQTDPEKIVFGVTPGVIAPLEQAIEGLAPGETFDVTVKAADAFGAERDPEQIVTLPRDIFEIEGKFDEETVHPGAVLPMMTADGFRISGTVVELTPNEVRMDFNHPLTGMDVRFKGSVMTVREATPEDLQPASGCGCSGGCGGGCGSGECGDSSCGNGGCCGGR